MDTQREGPKISKSEEFGYQGPAVWQNTEEEEAFGNYVSVKNILEWFKR